MKKRIVMALLIMTTFCGFAQEKISTMESILATQKPRTIQFQLWGASSPCNGVLDCNRDLLLASGSAVDPCLWDMLACHLKSTSRDFGAGRQSWLFGGAKINAEIGPLTFSIGKHKNNVVLVQAPFIEGSYQTGFRSSVSFGILHTQTDISSQNIWYVEFRKTL